MPPMGDAFSSLTGLTNINQEITISTLLQPNDHYPYALTILSNIDIKIKNHSEYKVRIDTNDLFQVWTYSQDGDAWAELPILREYPDEMITLLPGEERTMSPFHVKVSEQSSGINIRVLAKAYQINDGEGEKVVGAYTDIYLNPAPVINISEININDILDQTTEILNKEGKTFDVISIQFYFPGLGWFDDPPLYSVYWYESQKPDSVFSIDYYPYDKPHQLERVEEGAQNFCPIPVTDLHHTANEAMNEFINHPIYTKWQSESKQCNILWLFANNEQNNCQIYWQLVFSNCSDISEKITLNDLSGIVLP